MAIIFRNSPNTTSATPLVSLNGEDYSINDIAAIVAEVKRLRPAAAYEESLSPHVATPAPTIAPAAPAAAAAASNATSGLQTPS